MFLKRVFFRQSGISLLNVVIAVALGGLVTFGLVTIIQRSQTQQKQAELAFVLESLTQNFQSAFNRPATWKETIEGNPEMLCIKEGTACENSLASNRYDLNLPKIKIFSNGNLLLDEGSMAFTPTGSPCTGIKTDQVSDECPIRYRVRFYLDKSYSTTGINVTIVGKLIFLPGPKSIYRGRYSSYSLNSTTLQKYDFIVSKKIEHQVDTKIEVCQQDGITIYPGQSRTFYKHKNVGLGEFCENEIRTCELIDGRPSLDGSFRYDSCVQNCYGEWGPCICDGNAPRPGRVGVRIYNLKVPNNEWGRRNCDVQGATRSCTTNEVCF